MNETNLDVLALAAESLHESVESIAATTASPDLKTEWPGHWEYYLPQAIKDNWTRLSDESKTVAYFIAAEEARNQLHCD